MSLGGPEILVIIVIALLVLGPDKLPGAMKAVGKAFAEIKKYQNLAKTEIDKAVAMAEVEEAHKVEDSHSQATQSEESTKSKLKDSTSPAAPLNDVEEKVKKTPGPVKPIIDDEE